MGTVVGTTGRGWVGAGVTGFCIGERRTRLGGVADDVGDVEDSGVGVLVWLAKGKTCSKNVTCRDM